jgi:hypothetical protein
VELAYCAGTRPQLPAGPDQPDDLQRDRLEPDGTTMRFPGRREPGPCRLPDPDRSGISRNPARTQRLEGAHLCLAAHWPGCTEAGPAPAVHPLPPHWPSPPRPRSWASVPSARSANPPCTGSKTTDQHPAAGMPDTDTFSRGAYAVPKRLAVLPLT